MKKLIYDAEILVIDGKEIPAVQTIALSVVGILQKDRSLKYHANLEYTTPAGVFTRTFPDATCTPEDNMSRILLGSEDNYILCWNNHGRWVDDNGS